MFETEYRLDLTKIKAIQQAKDDYKKKEKAKLQALRYSDPSKDFVAAKILANKQKYERDLKEKREKEAKREKALQRRAAKEPDVEPEKINAQFK